MALHAHVVSIVLFSLRNLGLLPRGNQVYPCGKSAFKLDHVIIPWNARYLYLVTKRQCTQKINVIHGVHLLIHTPPIDKEFNVNQPLWIPKNLQMNNKHSQHSNAIAMNLHFRKCEFQLVIKFS
jgi:hypothetical protein